jgi:UDP-3-O-[3-hydroxymyristoyl] glucosamine N-acyltransferase
VEELATATATDVSFLANPLYRSLLTTTQAGVVCVDPSIPANPTKCYLISPSPSATFQTIVRLFLGGRTLWSGFSGIHPSAVIHPTAQLSDGVEIGPHAVIDAGCRIGRASRIGAGVILGPDVELGEECRLYPHATVREGCKLGHRVILQPGAVIGSCGFGYTTTPQGIHEKQEQLGIVVLEDDVEIGANTAIDRARFKETRIARGTKVDNLVQIGHNVLLGPHNLIVSQTGISGSVTTGHHVVMGGQTGVVGHVKVASGAMFAARSGIKKSIHEGGKYGGNPAVPLNEHQREQATLRKLARKTPKIT